MCARSRSGSFDCATCGSTQDIEQMEGYYAKDVIVSGIADDDTPLAPVVWLCRDCAEQVGENNSTY